MNILGVVLPTSIFQQKGQQQSLTTNGSTSKCTSVCSVVSDASSSKSSQKARKKTALDGKPKESNLHSGSCQTPSNGSNELFILPDGSVMTSLDGLSSNILNGEENVQKNSVKKKRKKKKSRKSSSSDVIAVAAVEVADQTCSSAENTCITTETLPSLFVEEARNSNGITHDCSRAAQTILVLEEIKPSVVSADAQCTSTRSKESAETCVGKELPLGSFKHDSSRTQADSQKVDTSRSTRSAIKQVRTFLASDATLKNCESEPSHGSSKCARDCDDKLSISSSSLTESCVSGCHALMGNNSNRKMDTCQCASQKNTSEPRRLDVNKGEVTVDFNGCKSEGPPPETFCSGSLSETMFASANSRSCSSSNMHNSKGENKTSRDGIIFGTKSYKTSCGLTEIAAVSAVKTTEQDKRQSLDEMLYKHGNLNNVKKSGKEYGNCTWQRRVPRKRGQMKTFSGKDFIHCHRCRFAGLHDAPLLEERNFSPGRSGFTENFKDFESSVYLRDRNQGHVLEESFQWVPRQNFLDKVGDKLLLRFYPAANKEGRSIEELNWPSRWEKSGHCRQDFLARRSNLHIHRPRTRAVGLQKGILEVASLQYKFNGSFWGVITQGNQYNTHNLPETHDMRILDSGLASNKPSLQMLSNLFDGNVKKSASLKSNLPHDKNIKQDSIYRENPVKQIPDSFLDFSKVNDESQGHSPSEALNPLGMRMDSECSDKLAAEEEVCTGEKNINAKSNCRMKDTPVYISSQRLFQILHASYRSYMASEYVKLATGSPIAELEKLLCSVSPVMLPSPVDRHYDVIRVQCTPDVICRHQFHDVSLIDVWNWYEEHGNYGLEVKVEPSWTLKVSSDGPFRAYFVPYLSAVQLFCRLQHPKHSSNPQNKTDAPKKGQDGVIMDHFHSENFHPNYSNVGEMGISTFPKSTEKHTSDWNSFPLTPALASFDDSELLFEYFEKERPEQRKPLCAKIKELIGLGTSSHQMYGDSSKLECMNLQDLHPASWYSVAWYPIYRIPEGTFRASFLTYHPLGHVVKRCVRADCVDSGFCIISPVLGMESYNAQGECWFNLKEAVESFPVCGMSFSRSEILKERLRTLKETAATFSRGSVYKNQVEVRNIHPDYEFFLSRK